MKKQILFLLCGILCACADPLPPPERIQGRYLIKYQDGQIELLRLDVHSEFEQMFFRNQDDYAKGAFYLRHADTWEVQKTRGLPQIKFNRSYSLIDYGSLELLDRPVLGTGSTAVWMENKKDGSMMMEFIPDIGYMAYKIGGLGDKPGPPAK
jgi:hypothetical protein